MVMLLWASKSGTAKIECSFEMGKVKTFGGTIYFAVNGTCTIVKSFENSSVGEYWCSSTTLTCRALGMMNNLLFMTFFIMQQ